MEEFDRSVRHRRAPLKTYRLPALRHRVLHCHTASASFPNLSSTRERSQRHASMGGHCGTANPMALQLQLAYGAEAMGVASDGVHVTRRNRGLVPEGGEVTPTLAQASATGTERRGVGE